jgi:hypothetical protein
VSNKDQYSSIGINMYIRGHCNLSLNQDTTFSASPSTFLRFHHRWKLAPERDCIASISDEGVSPKFRQPWQLYRLYWCCSRLHRFDHLDCFGLVGIIAYQLSSLIKSCNAPSFDLLLDLIESQLS